MITISGIEVEPGNENAPTIYDIGYALSREQRFGNFTRKSYTVFQHLYAAAYLAKLLGHSARIQLLSLLHDAHESVTRDIPRSWKPDAMRVFQREIDARIFKSLGLAVPSEEELLIVKQIDDALLAAELPMVGPREGPLPAGPPLEALKFSSWYAVTDSPREAGHMFEDTVDELLRRVKYGEQ